MSKDALNWIDDEITSLKEAGLSTNMRVIESPMQAWVRIDGRRLLNFCANNYLGLANHPRMRAAAHQAIDKYGIGPGAVRTIAGTMSLHVQLEERLAAFKHAPACITLQSGFTANLATIPCLVGKGDFIFSDELNHASIIDGSRLIKALKETGIAEGRIFDRALLEKAVQELKRQYLTRGKYGVDITTTITPLERNRVGINFNIEEGVAAKITTDQYRWCQGFQRKGTTVTV